MDTDIAVKELDLIYMKGEKAHCGFPEIAYSKFASQLVDRGYRVARVEQTETPDMLKERNSKSAKGHKVRRAKTLDFMMDMSSCNYKSSTDARVVLLLL